jgi:WS/DGAT/MGAT family acyltransferase
VPEAQYADWMSASDALLWINERDPMLRSTITSLLLLDGPPNLDRFRQAVERSLEGIPRLRQRVVIDPLGAAPPRWERDALFDLSYHYRRIRTADKGTLRELLDMAAVIAMQAFDKDRPLWELYVVDGLEGERSALILKLHHSITDGVGLVRMTSSLVERTREEVPRPRRASSETASEPAAAGAFGEALRAIRHRAGENLDLVSRLASALPRGVGRLLREPRAAVQDAWGGVASLRRLLQPVHEPMSPLMRARSTSIRFDVLSLPLEDLKRAAQVAGGTLNDAFVAAVAGGLRIYHERHGQPVDELRMTMPVNLRDDGEHGRQAGNQFAPARFPIPVGVRDPVERIRILHQRVMDQRAEPALPYTEEVSSVLARLPRALSVGFIGSMLKAIDLVTSNVPGSPDTMYCSGAKIDAMFGFGPLSGAATNVTLFSYDGEVRIGINTDRAAVPDPVVFVACLEEGLREVLAAGLSEVRA